ncbi:MAG TPA: FAD-containing monooxygenase EthA, partial [Alcanivorax sp.]|nr:FAD-containing monooxygenase EthA [Alcanivorax sp.]
PTARRQLGDDIDMKHFRPSYNPWDERLCAVPNGDLFKVLRRGEASIVTDHIDTFTENGIRLKSGEELDADIVITATGLDLQLLGGAELSVDGETREPRDVLVYKGVMLRDVPNMAMVFGYTNASWTLKADIAAEYVCRLLNYMSRKGLQQVTPKDHDGSDTDKTFLDLQSGYVQRAAHRLPRQGDKAPWKVLSNYLYDLPRLRYGRLNDDALEFVKAEGGKRRRLGVSRG